MLGLQPISWAEACAFVAQHHHHHLPPQGWRFGIAVNDGEKVVGVVTVGRPVARHQDDGWTLEITRCCTDGTKNAASKLYAAVARAARALGYRRVVTYTLASEAGTSLLAAGYRVVWQTEGGSWSCPTRPRVDRHPLEAKTLWQTAPETRNGRGHGALREVPALPAGLLGVADGAAAALPAVPDRDGRDKEEARKPL